MDGRADRQRSKLLCRETRLKIGPVLASPYLPPPPSHPTAQHTLNTHLSVPYNDLTPARTMSCANWIRFCNFVFINLPTLHKNLTSKTHKMNMHVGRSRVCENRVPRPRIRWKDNIKIDHNSISCEDWRWMEPAEERLYCRTVVFPTRVPLPEGLLRLKHVVRIY